MGRVGVFLGVVEKIVEESGFYFSNIFSRVYSFDFVIVVENIGRRFALLRLIFIYHGFLFRGGIIFHCLSLQPLHGL